MILRSSLLQRRPDISSAEFSRHFKDVQGPLAAMLPKARAYKQNHRARRWDLPEANFLPRIEAYSQIWFDDLHTMYQSMGSEEQKAAYADFENISNRHIVTVQEPGEIIGTRPFESAKLTLILAGQPEQTDSVNDALHEFADQNVEGQYALRTNQIIETGDSTRVRPQLGAFAEFWFEDDSVAEHLLNRGLLLETGSMTTCWVMHVDEVVLVEGPEF